MDKNHLQALIKKYMDGTASTDERNQVDQWYKSEAEKGSNWEDEQPGDAEQVRQKILQNLRAHIKSSSQPKSHSYQKAWRVAASVLIFSVFAAIGYELFTQSRTEKQQQIIVSRPKESKVNRFITLADGTVIILRPGSEVKYAYTSALRTVCLTGEAYFDVQHQSNRPFIVNSGNTRTVVLGTAFNIRAIKGEPVAVTVVRGKVSVKVNGNNNIAVLNPSEQIKVDEKNDNLTTQTAKTTEVMSWTRADMQFQNLPFKTIAAHLSERYNVQISFANPQLEKCLITGKFLGTESLERVLRIVSETMGTGYQINQDGRIYLTGNACN